MRRIVIPVALGVFIGLLVWFALFFGTVQHWASVHTGTKNGGPDIYYNFWSGFGSDLGEVTLVAALVGGLISIYRSQRCHNANCWVGPSWFRRFAHHTTKKGHKLCKVCIGLRNEQLDLHEIHEDHT